MKANNGDNMRKLHYESPGSDADREAFVESPQNKSKAELIRLADVAESCDEDGKGYVSQWESTIRHDIGYTRGHGQNHSDRCGCPRCQEERVGVYAPKKK